MKCLPHLIWCDCRFHSVIYYTNGVVSTLPLLECCILFSNLGGFALKKYEAAIISAILEDLHLKKPQVAWCYLSIYVCRVCIKEPQSAIISAIMQNLYLKNPKAAIISTIKQDLYLKKLSSP